MIEVRLKNEQIQDGFQSRLLWHHAQQIYCRKMDLYSSLCQPVRYCLVLFMHNGQGQGLFPANGFCLLIAKLFSQTITRRTAATCPVKYNPNEISLQLIISSNVSRRIVATFDSCFPNLLSLLFSLFPCLSLSPLPQVPPTLPPRLLPPLPHSLMVQRVKICQRCRRWPRCQKTPWRIWGVFFSHHKALQPLSFLSLFFFLLLLDFFLSFLIPCCCFIYLFFSPHSNHFILTKESFIGHSLNRCWY